MKIGKLEVVNDLMNVRKRCLSALVQAKQFIQDCEKDEHRNTSHVEDTKVFQQSYYGSVYKHSDGSGYGIEMDGCYVGKFVAMATVGILQAQIDTVEEDLKMLGVEIE